MMEAQFLGIKYKNEKPYFLLYKDKMFIVPVDGNIYIKKGEKRCAGYYDLERHCYMPCAKLNKVDEKTSQCDECREKSGFYYCLGCHGMNCRADNDKALNFCRQEHAVYLSLFGDRIKVGTAAFYRKDARLLEQGGLAYMFIAKAPTGKIARLIEYMISKEGMTLQVLSSYKIKNLVFLESKDTAERKLMDTYEMLRRSLDDNLTKYFIKPEFHFSEKVIEINNNLFKDSAQGSLFSKDEVIIKDYSYDLNPSMLKGKILNVTGQILVIEDDKIEAFDTKKLNGYIVDFKRN